MLRYYLKYAPKKKKAISLDRDLEKLVALYISGTIKYVILHGKQQGDFSKIK